MTLTKPLSERPSEPASAPTSGFDWPTLMRAGMIGLRLPPETFWALTPAELGLLLGVESGAAPLKRDGLDALMAAYPDRETGEDT